MLMHSERQCVQKSYEKTLLPISLRENQYQKEFQGGKKAYLSLHMQHFKLTSDRQMQRHYPITAFFFLFC